MNTDTHLVTAYVGPQVTKNGSRLAHLYREGKRWSVGIVYQERFPELPHGLGEKLMADPIIPGSAPEYDAAKIQGVLQSCPPFTITTEVTPDNKHTKSIVEILGTTGVAAPQNTVAAGRVFTSAIEGMEFNALSEDEVRELIDEIGQETYWKAEVALTHYASLAAKEDLANVEAAVFGAIWRDINDQYRTARPALLTPVEKASGPQYPDPMVIYNGERADFLQHLADQHSQITDADRALDICKQLGIDKTADNADGRVDQAKRVWLFVDLVAVYMVNEQEAIRLVNDLFPEDVPF